MTTVTTFVVVWNVLGLLNYITVIWDMKKVIGSVTVGDLCIGSLFFLSGPFGFFLTVLLWLRWLIKYNKLCNRIWEKEVL